VVYIECVNESGEFENIMNSKLLHLFGVNTYEYSDVAWRHADRRGFRSMASLTAATFSSVRAVFTVPPFVLNPGLESTSAMNTKLSSKFTLSDHVFL
jgi:hypothetical protein